MLADGERDARRLLELVDDERNRRRCQIGEPIGGLHGVPVADAARHDEDTLRTSDQRCEHGALIARSRRDQDPVIGLAERIERHLDDIRRGQRNYAEVTRQIDGQLVTGTVPITYQVQPGDTIVIKERWF